MGTEQQQQDENEELSLPRAAKLIGVSRQTAYLWVLTHRVAARKVAGRYVVTRGEVARIVEQRATGTWARVAA